MENRHSYWDGLAQCGRIETKNDRHIPMNERERVSAYVCADAFIQYKITHTNAELAFILPYGRRQ